MRFSIFVYISVLFLAACAANPPAPVIDRAPVTTGSKTGAPGATPGITSPARDKDWRPDVHVVKKGDTLHSIGLEYGYDYKEIAQKNNLQPPYIIHIGQQLQLPAGVKDTAVTSPSLEEKGAAENGVVITPLKIDPVVNIDPAVGSTPVPVTKPPAVGGPLLLSSPKAIREPYSEQAMAPPKPVQPADIAKVTEPNPVAEPKPGEPKPKEAEPVMASATGWAWPASGKVLARSAKGIDIAGTEGQAILASAPGKVIYSGSDLRGYGKLVIVKHDKDYLSVYAHNSQILVKEGQQVSRGQKIAEMGSTDSDKVKLHFEIRHQGKSVDPGKYLPVN
jgi:lipoprotein NlpD